MAIADKKESGRIVDDPDAVRSEWLGRLDALTAEVEGWVERSGWRTRVVPKPTRDGELGRFEVPLLLMERDGVQVALNPLSRFAVDADGCVDLYVVPAYDHVAALYLIDGRWMIDHVSAEAGTVVPQGVPLSEESLNRTLVDMAGREAQ